MAVISSLLVSFYVLNNLPKNAGLSLNNPFCDLHGFGNPFL